MSLDNFVFLKISDDMPIRGGSRTAAISKMERFVIIVHGWKPLTIITKRSILDVVAVLDTPLPICSPECLLSVSLSHHNWKNCFYHKSVHKSHLTLNRKINGL